MHHCYLTINIYIVFQLKEPSMFFPHILNPDLASLSYSFTHYRNISFCFVSFNRGSYCSNNFFSFNRGSCCSKTFIHFFRWNMSLPQFLLPALLPVLSGTRLTRVRRGMSTSSPTRRWRSTACWPSPARRRPSSPSLGQSRRPTAGSLFRWTSRVCSVRRRRWFRIITENMVT